MTPQTGSQLPKTQTILIPTGPSGSKPEAAQPRASWKNRTFRTRASAPTRGACPPPVRPFRIRNMPGTGHPAPSTGTRQSGLPLPGTKRFLARGECESGEKAPPAPEPHAPMCFGAPHGTDSRSLTRQTENRVSTCRAGILCPVARARKQFLNHEETRASSAPLRSSPTLQQAHSPQALQTGPRVCALLTAARWPPRRGACQPASHTPAHPC